ncbi:MAG TPA: MraY family glycosyltransferase [Dehalococcoidia bacterium]|nr:MraY family glycosyltransferase [Dehalococcoidia bacterium]
MNVYLLTLLLAAGIALATAVALEAYSHRMRVPGVFRVDRGAGERPCWGGVAVFVAFAVTPFVASALSAKASEFFSPKSGEFLGFLAAAALIFAVGLVDDWKALGYKPKLVVQVVAASAVYAAGYSIDKLAMPWGAEITLGFMAPVLTVLWIVFFTNAINLIDGRDGAATGVAVLAAVPLAYIAADSHHPTVAIFLVAIAGAGLGFIPFNLPPANSYLGDSGALLIGFLLGSLSIRAATGVTEAFFFAVPVIAFGFPILDTVLAALRRALDRKHPFGRDADHIHNRLENAGFGPRGLLLVIYGMSMLFSGAAIVMHGIEVFLVEAAIMVGFAAVLALVLAKLGYLVTLWNSHSIVWLRRRLTFESESEGKPLDSGDSTQRS